MKRFEFYRENGIGTLVEITPTTPEEQKEFEIKLMKSKLSEFDQFIEELQEKLESTLEKKRSVSEELKKMLVGKI